MVATGESQEPFGESLVRFERRSATYYLTMLKGALRTLSESKNR
jgi:hypothetical protein